MSQTCTVGAAYLGMLAGATQVPTTCAFMSSALPLPQARGFQTEQQDYSRLLHIVTYTCMRLSTASESFGGTPDPFACLAFQPVASFHSGTEDLCMFWPVKGQQCLFDRRPCSHLSGRFLFLAPKSTLHSTSHSKFRHQHPPRKGPRSLLPNYEVCTHS